MIVLFCLVAFVVLCFASVLIFGAPYLPTLRTITEQALDMLDLKAGQVLLDLGSGDGTVLIRAAQRGIKSVGYELNPLLFMMSWLRTRKYRHLITVKFGNFWQADWPEVDAVFVFLHTRFMERLDQRLLQESQQKPQTLLSFTFTIPGKKPAQQKGGLFLYKYDTGKVRSK